jgi:hypothetical protein
VELGSLDAQESELPQASNMIATPTHEETHGFESSLPGGPSTIIEVENNSGV